VEDVLIDVKIQALNLAVSQREPNLHPRLVRLEFVLGKVAQGQDFLRVLRFLSVRGIPLELREHSLTATNAKLSQHLVSALNNT
jgi:hypothetical protein